MRQFIAALRHPSDYAWWELRPWRRHSLVLAVAGVMHALIGVAYAVTPSNPVRNAALKIPLTLAPIEVWGGLFVLVGLLALLSSRWPPASEAWGYSAMSGLAALWAAFYACGMVIAKEPGAANGLLIWTVLAFLWWAIAGLANPYDLRPSLRDHDHE